MKLYDCLVIGAGVTGTAIARELSRYKLNIALLEKEQEVSFGVSKSNSGIIHPGTQNPPNTLKARLCVAGNVLTRRLCSELGVDFKLTGELIVAFNPFDESQLLRLEKRALSLGVRGLRIVDRKWLKRHEPNLNGQVTAALFAKYAGILSPYRYVYALSESAVRNGVELYTDTAVTNITRVSQYFEVTTARGIFKTRYLVNAAGLFADEISGMLGVRDFKISPRKGEEYILDKKKEYLTNHLIFPLPSSVSKGILVIKTIDGNPMVGPTASMAVDKQDLSTSEEGFKNVFSAVKKLVPSIDEKDIIAYFAGLRPVAGEDFIIRHEDKAKGFVNVAGIQSPGLTAAAAIALEVSGILKSTGLQLKKKKIFRRRFVNSEQLSKLSFTQGRKLIKKDPEYGDIVCRCEMVSARQIKDAIKAGARTMDGIKFRTRAQAGRCHGSFCAVRTMKLLAQGLNVPLTGVTKKGRGSEIIKSDRAHD